VVFFQSWPYLTYKTERTDRAPYAPSHAISPETMKKLAAVFAIAVLGPSLVLTWLATRSLRDQEIVVHSQRALLHQGTTDALAGDLNAFLGDVRHFYGRLLGDLINELGPDDLSGNFDTVIRSRWSQAAIGAAVTDDGRWLNPAITSTEPEIRRFLSDTQLFLLNKAASEVYVAPDSAGNVVVVKEFSEPNASARPILAERRASPGISRDKLAAEEPADSGRGFEKLKRFKKNLADPAVTEPTASTPSPAATSAPAAPLPKVADPIGASAMSAPASAASESTAAGLGSAAKPQAEKATEGKIIAQRKVAADEYAYRGRSNFGQQRFEANQSVTALADAGDVSNQAGGGSGAMPRPPDAPYPTTAAAGPAMAPAAVPAPALPQTAAPVNVGEDNSFTFNRSRTVTPVGQFDQSPQQAAADPLADNLNRQALSNLDVNNGQLREIMSDAPEGAISRFVTGGLQVLLWRRDPAAPGLTFWVQLNLDELKRDLTSIIRETGQLMGETEVSLALLDASGQVVAQTKEGFVADWRRPFVATEVGELLPHWEVAAYLIDPRAVARSARAARFTVWMLVPVLLIAIGVGSVLIIRDIGREMHLARQKTDFVSNVSHELKTPLTSIRMFSDLLNNRPEMPDGKRIEYSGIISREAARLSRLINNLLDFSRMERGEKRYRIERFDAGAMVRETVENYRPQIESDGFQLKLIDGLNGGSLPVEIEGDRDALSQVLLNLLSNAEKYGGEAKEITVETQQVNGSIVIDVLDRGPGVSRKHAAKIFEKFFRADDSLSSGIEGSGLGLTLARQIARAHGGDVEFSPRQGGGSRFTVRLPVIEDRP
jgi:signal transduction histidine kinase